MIKRQKNRKGLQQSQSNHRVKKIKKSEADLTVFRFYKLLPTTNEKSCRKEETFNKINKKEDKMRMNQRKRRKFSKTSTRI